MNELYVMGAALIVAGLYISYQYSVITKYRRTLIMATYALQEAYIAIVEEAEDEATDSE